MIQETLSIEFKPRSSSKNKIEQFTTELYCEKNNPPSGPKIIAGKLIDVDEADIISMEANLENVTAYYQAHKYQVTSLSREGNFTLKLICSW